MNNARRKAIAEILHDLAQLRERIAQVKEEEQDAFDKLPESIQRSERGEDMEAVVSSLDSVDDDLGNVTIALTEAKGDVW